MSKCNLVLEVDLWLIKVIEVSCVFLMMISWFLSDFNFKI